MDSDDYVQQVLSVATATSIGAALTAIGTQYVAISAANTERYLAAARNAENLATVELATTAEAVRRILGSVATRPPTGKLRSSRYRIDRTSASLTADLGAPPVVT